MNESLRNLLEKLGWKKEEEMGGIPPDCVRCTRCGKVVKKEKATTSLPENLWVCDRCYFGYAELMKYPRTVRAKLSIITSCEVCGKELLGLYCTRNICKRCCEAGKCTVKENCNAYPEIHKALTEHNKEDIVRNPSRRVRKVEEWPQ